MRSRILASLVLCSAMLTGLIGWSVIPAQATGSCNSSPRFKPALELAAGGVPRVTTGDANNDTKPDIIAVDCDPCSPPLTANYYISVRLGNGDGTFGAEITSAIDSTDARSIIVGNFVSDSDLDVAVAGEDGPPLEILVGDGTGSFASDQIFSTGITAANHVATYAGSFALATGLGVKIIIYDSQEGEYVINTTVSSASYSYVTMGELNGDSHFDFIGSGGSTINIYYGEGPDEQGVLQFSEEPNSISIGERTQLVAIANINNAAGLDLVVPYYGPNSPASPGVAVLLGDGTGEFAPSSESPFSTGNYPDYPQIADFNDDGEVDLAIAGSNDGRLSVLLGEGGGNFGSPTDFAVSGTPLSSAMADFNGDTLPDVAVSSIATTGHENLSILLNALYSEAVSKTDYSGDGKTDYAVWRPSNTTWYILNANGTSNSSTQFGASGDQPVPGDYDGDNKTDIAVFRPSNTTWYISKSSNSSLVTQSWGASGDKLTPGDYDGDGKTDIAVWRPSNGTFYILQSSNSSLSSTAFGTSGDKPVPGDYDGDCQTDLAIFRPSNTTWYILQSSNSSVVSTQWGLSTDKLVPGDYDGDGKTDIAVWRDSNGTWYILKSSDANLLSYQVGASGDKPQPGDYDGDGKTDVAVWEPSSGDWEVRRSSTGSVVTQGWGSSGDVPASAAYVIE